MPTFSEVVITFPCDFIIDGETPDSLKILTVYNNQIYLNSNWVWVATRLAAFQVTVGTPTANPGERTALNFKTAFDLDHPTGYVTTVQNTNELLIQSELEDEFFTGFRFDATNCSITIDITNLDPGGLIQDITVMIPRYYITYCDDFNTDREVLILERGFVGLEQELMADVNPISIT